MTPLINHTETINNADMQLEAQEGTSDVSLVRYHLSTGLFNSRASVEEKQKALELVARKTAQQLQSPEKYLKKDSFFERGISSCSEWDFTQAAQKIISQTSNHKHRAGSLSLIERAIEENNLPYLEWLLDQEPIPSFEKLEATPLYHAIQHNKEEIALFLLNHPLLHSYVDVHARDRWGKQTLLHYATLKNMPQVCVELANRGADINISNQLGKTPLHFSLMHSEVVTLQLLEKDQSVKGDKLDPVLLELAVKNNYYKVVKELVKRKIVIATDWSNPKAIIQAFENGNDEIAHFLLKHSFKKVSRFLMKSIPEDNHTYVHIAAAKNMVKVLRLMHENGLNLELTDKKEQTVLQYALSNRLNVKTINFIMNIFGFNHLDLCALNNAQRLTLLNWAAAHRRDDFFHFWLDSLFALGQDANINFVDSASNFPLFVAVSHNQLEWVKELYNKGANIDFAPESDTLLHQAARLGHVEIFKYLMENGAKWTSNEEQSTPLHAICGSKQQCLLTDYLPRVEEKDLLTPNDDGRTPLSLALQFNSAKFFDSLEPFLSPYRVTNYPLTFVAIQYNNFGLVKHLFFLGLGMYESESNDAIQTPLELALDNENNQIAEFIILKGFEEKNEGFLNAAVKAVVTHGNLFLLQHFIDRNFDFAQDFEGEKLSVQAARCGQLGMLKKLIDIGIRVNQPVPLDCSVLRRAVCYGHLPVVSFLLINGVKIEEKDFDVFELAADFKHESVLGVMLQWIERKTIAEDTYFNLLFFIMNRLHEDHSEGIYQIRRKNWNVLFGGTETQAVYERMSHAEIIKKLKKGVGDFEKIIEALAYHRWCLALGLNHKNSVFFGEERQVHLITGFKGRYDEYGQRLFTLDSTKNAPYLMDVKKTQHTIRGQFVVKIEEKLIPLTRFNYNNSIQNGKWFHTSPEYFNDLTPFIEGLYENILAMKEPTLVELSHAIGFFHWYFTHLTLYNRGSSSITDQTTKLLWAYHSFRVTPWKEGVIPDCEALSTPNPDEFAQNYLNLMENAPYKDKRILSSSLNMKVALLVNLAKNFQLHQLEALLPELVANYLKCQLTKILDVIKNSTKCVTSN